MCFVSCGKTRIPAFMEEISLENCWKDWFEGGGCYVGQIETLGNNPISRVPDIR